MLVNLRKASLASSTEEIKKVPPQSECQFSLNIKEGFPKSRGFISLVECENTVGHTVNIGSNYEISIS